MGTSLRARVQPSSETAALASSSTATGKPPPRRYTGYRDHRSAPSDRACQGRRAGARCGRGAAAKLLELPFDGSSVSVEGRLGAPGWATVAAGKDGGAAALLIPRVRSGSAGGAGGLIGQSDGCEGSVPSRELSAQVSAAAGAALGVDTTGARPSASGHGMRARTVVPRPGLDSISSRPSIAASRSPSPRRPVPRSGSAPPTLWPLIATSSRPPLMVTVTEARLAEVCLAMFMSASETTK
jgi:hypothetical protein